MRLSLLRANLSAILFLSLAVARGWAACPASTINGVDSTLPADSLESPPPGFYGLQVGSYDLTVGSIAATVYFKCCGLATSEVTARDIYRVVGVPSGHPVTLTAELSCTRQDNSGGGHAPAHFSWGVSTDSASVSGSGDAGYMTSTVLRLDIQALGMQDFPVSWHVDVLQGFDAGNADIRGRWRFTGLPPGASVESCQGFAGGIVPTMTSTWGLVKARYR